MLLNCHLSLFNRSEQSTETRLEKERTAAGDDEDIDRYVYYNSPEIFLLLFANCRSQFFARTWEISQTVRITCRAFLSHVCISVQPSKFFIGEKTKTGYLRGVNKAFFLPKIDR